MELGLRERLSQVADHSLTLLDLAHVSVSQLLDLILVGLVKLIDLVLSLLFSNDGLPLVVSEALQDALMVHLHFLLLLLLLLELQTHEFVLLLGNGGILDSLALERLVLLLKFLDNLFELLDALRVSLILLLLGLSLGTELSVKSRLEFSILISQLFLGILQLIELPFHLLLSLVPLLSLNRVVLLLILEGIL